MVRINSLALAALAALGVSARPAKRQVPGVNCMTADQAQFVASNYGTLIANYTSELADKTLSSNFTDYSESVNTLINTCPQGAAAISLPLLAPTFTSRQMFEIGQGQQPNINFNQLNIWPSCDAVVIRWETTNTAPIPSPKPVVGLIAMEVVPNTNLTTAAEYPWLIDYVYSEFDAGSWLQNLQEAGICGTPPSDSPAIPQGPTSSASPSSTAASECTCSAVPTSSAEPTAVASQSATSPVSPSSSVSAASAGSTTGASLVVNPDGSVSEVPCDK